MTINRKISRSPLGQIIVQQQNEFTSGKFSQRMMKSEKGKSGILYESIYTMFNIYTSKYII